jgi:hypothetical protein
MRFFFYGTMRDPEVRRTVLGARAARLCVRPAVLPGFRAHCARHGAFPVLVRRTGARARGELAEGLELDDLLRLFNFEGPDYRPARQVAIDAEGRRLDAWVLLADSARRASATPWALRRWQLYHKARLMPQVRLWVREFDRLESGSVEIAWPVRRRLKAWRESGDLGD